MGGMGGLKPISWRIFDKFLILQGCELKRVRGDHLIYNREGLIRPLVVPKINNIPVFIIQNNLRLLSVDSHDFLEWLKEN